MFHFFPHLDNEKEAGCDVLVEDENCGYLIPDENCGYLNPVIKDFGKPKSVNKYETKALPAFMGGYVF